MTFWKLWVRMPSLALAAASIGLGAWGAIDWAPALAIACVAAALAKFADRKVSRALAEEEAANVVEFPLVRERGSRYDRAA